MLRERGGDVRQMRRDRQLGRKVDARRPRRAARGDDGCGAGELRFDVRLQAVGWLAGGEAPLQRGDSLFERRPVREQGVVHRRRQPFHQLDRVGFRRRFGGVHGHRSGGVGSVP
jgi:hypothetical protein